VKYYAYYPGCSMEATGAPVEASIHAIAKPLDINFMELEDWTCCGSSPLAGVDKFKAIGITARVLALAEKTGLDLVTPCSSCYTILREANDLLKEDHDLSDKIRSTLSAAGMTYNGTVNVRHVVEVLFNDLGTDVLKSKIVRPLTGLKVACYHGCQQVRPSYGYDDPEYPDWLDKMVVSLGAETVNFPLKARCCGSSLVISEPDTAIELIYKLLQNASDNGAQAIVTTTCPLCHLAIDGYQASVNRKYKTKFNLPALAITQLIAFAIGLDFKASGLIGNITSPKNLLRPFMEAKISSTEAEAPAT